MIGRGARRSGERSSGSPGVKAGVVRALKSPARGTTGRLLGGAELRASGSDRALRNAVTLWGRKRVSRASEGAGRGTVKVLRRAHRKLL